jgi:hypothetical protein
MQGQQTVAANTVSGSSSIPTTINASATGTSGTTSNTNEKPLTPINRSNNTPPPSVAPATTTNVNGPGENDAMNSLDEQTGTSGDLINKDRS